MMKTMRLSLIVAVINSFLLSTTSLCLRLQSKAASRARSNVLFSSINPSNVKEDALKVTSKAPRGSATAARKATWSTDNTKVDDNEKKFFIETHGCQMNLADSDIVRSVLLTAGYSMCEVLEDADLILTNTCAIRENAESKIFQRLKYFNSLKKNKYKVSNNDTKKPGKRLIVGVLGCMAERLKEQLLEEEGVDFVAGPDAYRDLPNLLNSVSPPLFSAPTSVSSSSSTSNSSASYLSPVIPPSHTTDVKAANIQLSLEETYADISPVRLAEGNTHAFVTITRGCDNHCAFCIVPYTRGKERSRPISSILSEVCDLREQGYKEIVLLGQNVNSYFDQKSASIVGNAATEYEVAEGFTQRAKRKEMKAGSSAEVDISASDSDFKGVRFGELLLRVSEIDPEMRIRFQSPHPKDFPDDVLRLIASVPNVCNSLHMPAQHGSTSVLERMQRGYSRESYLSLVKRAREIIAGDTNQGIGLGLSSDFISGFCGETEDEHADLISLIKEVGFDQAFTYSYSRREQTYAGLFYKDDVPADVKARRLAEVIDVFQSGAMERNNRLEVGRLHLVLIEGEGKKSAGGPTWTGRTDTNKRVLFEDCSVVDVLTKEDAVAIAAMPWKGESFLTNEDATLRQANEAVAAALAMSQSQHQTHGSHGSHKHVRGAMTSLQTGDYCVVKILRGRGHTLQAAVAAKISLQEAHSLQLPSLPTFHSHSHSF